MHNARSFFGGVGTYDIIIYSMSILTDQFSSFVLMQHSFRYFYNFYTLIIFVVFTPIFGDVFFSALSKKRDELLSALTLQRISQRQNVVL